MSDIAADLYPAPFGIQLLCVVVSAAGVMNMCALGYFHSYGRGDDFTDKQESILLQHVKETHSLFSPSTIVCLYVCSSVLVHTCPRRRASETG